MAVTTLTRRLHGDSRAVGLIVAGVCLVTLAFAGELLTLLPRLAFGALLLRVRVGLLHQSLFAAWGRHGRLEFAAIALVAAIVVGAGFLAGIVAGLVRAPRSS